MQIWTGLIDNNFVPMVKVVIAVSRRQRGSKNPAIAPEVHELVLGNIIININVREIIIINIVVTSRSPCGL